MEKNEKPSKFYTFMMYFGQGLGCHQREDRSYICRGRQCFLCARCLGVFIGQMAGIPLYFLNIHLGFYAILLLIPLILDGLVQYFHIIKSTNLRRLITGLLGGYGLITFIVHVIIYFI